VSGHFGFMAERVPHAEMHHSLVHYVVSALYFVVESIEYVNFSRSYMNRCCCASNKELGRLPSSAILRLRVRHGSRVTGHASAVALALPSMIHLFVRRWPPGCPVPHQEGVLPKVPGHWPAVGRHQGSKASQVLKQAHGQA
jgi:hypothetical protein